MLIRRIALLAFIYLATIFVLVLLYIYVPSEGAGLLHCPVYFFTGLYCPGCGSTRAIHSLLHGEIYQAFRYNPALIILLPAIILYLIAKSIYYVKGIDHDPLYKVPDSIFIGLLIILFTYAIMRNVSMFSFLAPTAI